MKRFISVVIIVCLFSMTLAYADNNSFGGTNYVMLGILTVVCIVWGGILLNKKAEKVRTFNKQWSKLKLGMTTIEARKLLGSPLKINNSVGIWGTSAQWVYNDLNSYEHRYLYFENGILTSWQD